MAEPDEHTESAVDGNSDRANPSRADGGGPGSEGRGSAQESLGEALTGLMGVLFRRGRVGVERAAVQTRFRLDLRQLKHDRDIMYQKLGRELRALVESGQLTHDGLGRGVERIAELDRKIASLEGDLGVAGAPPDDTPEVPSEG